MFKSQFVFFIFYEAPSAAAPDSTLTGGAESPARAAAPAEAEEKEALHMLLMCVIVVAPD